MSIQPEVIAKVGSKDSGWYAHCDSVINQWGKTGWIGHPGLNPADASQLIDKPQIGKCVVIRQREIIESCDQQIGRVHGNCQTGADETEADATEHNVQGRASCKTR
ncbi:hypothetical protein GCM10007858_28360 [Bradyrhizobium liaoningense]|nr:hypothetical protein GCM10007858_28360 [Bradyrhizobium liaoningense]